MNNPNSKYGSDKDPYAQHHAIMEASTKEASLILNANLPKRDIESRLEAIRDDRLLRMTRLMVYSMVEERKVANPNRFNLDQTIDFNHALKDVINDFADISMPPAALINRLTEFTFVQGKLPHDKKNRLGETFAEDFLGMWHEQAFENLLCSSTGTMTGQTTLDYEKMGIDIFVKTNIKDWVGIDVKSSLTGVREALIDHSYGEPEPIRVIKPKNLHGEPSYRQPLIRVGHNGEHFVLNVDYGLEGKLPMQISPPDYRHFDRDIATDLSGQLLNYIRTNMHKVDLFEKKPDYGFGRTVRRIGLTSINNFI